MWWRLALLIALWVPFVAFALGPPFILRWQVALRRYRERTLSESWLRLFPEPDYEDPQVRWCGRVVAFGGTVAIGGAIVAQIVQIILGAA